MRRAKFPEGRVVLLTAISGAGVSPYQSGARVVAISYWKLKLEILTVVALFPAIGLQAAVRTYTGDSPRGSISQGMPAVGGSYESSPFAVANDGKASLRFLSPTLSLSSVRQSTGQTAGPPVKGPAAITGNVDQFGGLVSAVSAVHGKAAVLEITTPQSVERNLVIPGTVTLEIPRTGRVIVGSGDTLTLNGDIVAGRYTIFDTTGVIQKGQSARATSRVLPEWFGALPTFTMSEVNASSNTVAIQRAVDYLQAPNNSSQDGGIVEFGEGTYFINSTIDIFGDSRYGIGDITFEGVGRDVSVIRGASNMPEGSPGIYILSEHNQIRNLGVSHMPGNGIVVANRSNIFFNVNSSYNKMSGFLFKRGFEYLLTYCHTNNNSRYGYEFKGGYTTSTTMLRCGSEYDSLGGYFLSNMNYSLLENCSGDFGLYGFVMENVWGTTLLDCSSEYTMASSYKVVASREKDMARGILMRQIRHLVLDNCTGGYSSLRDSARYYKTGSFLNVRQNGSSKIQIEVRNCTEDDRDRGNFYPGRPPSVVLDGKYIYYTEYGNSFIGPTIASNGALIRRNVYTYYTFDGIQISGSAIVTTLGSEYRDTDTFSGEILVEARNKPFTDPGGKLSTYLLLVNYSGNSSQQLSVVSQLGFLNGKSRDWPSFSWSLDGARLVATPVGLTNGTFYFRISPLGGTVKPTRSEDETE